MTKPITVYTQPGCKPCHQAMQKLDDAGLDYDTVDITKNGDAYTYITQVLKAKSIPVITSDTHPPIIGNIQDRLAELIEYYTASETGL